MKMLVIAECDRCKIKVTCEPVVGETVPFALVRAGVLHKVDRIIPSWLCDKCNEEYLAMEERYAAELKSFFNG